MTPGNIPSPYESVPMADGAPPAGTVIPGRTAPSEALIPLLVVTGVLIPALLALGLATIHEYLVLGITVGVIGLVLFVVRPFWGLIFLIVLVYTRPTDYVPRLQEVPLALIVALVTLIGVWLHLFLNREKVVRTPMNGLIVAFGLIAMASTFMGGDPMAAASEVGKLVILVLLVFNLVRTPNQYRIYTTALIVFTCYLACYSIYLYFTGGAIKGSGADAYEYIERSAGTGVFGDPNDLAATIVAGLVLALYRVLESRPAVRPFYLGLAGLMVWGILMTSSRGGLLATMVAFGGFLLFSRRKALALPLAVLGVVLLLTLGSSHMTSFDTQDYSAKGRFQYWHNGIMALVQRPLIGVGYRQYPEINEGRDAHNSFVICFTELGLAGYFCWLGCIYYAFRSRPAGETAVQEREGAGRDGIAAKLALASYLVAAFWINHTYLPVMYIMISLPIVQQLATSGQSEGVRLRPQERFRDFLRILALCLGSIVVIQLLVMRFS